MNVLALLSVSMLAETATTEPERNFFERIWDSLVKWFITDGAWLRIVGVVLVILIGLLVVKIIMVVTRKIINRTKLHGIVGNFILTILKIVLLSIYVIIVLKAIGVDTTSFVALLTVGTLAISLAMQSIISNFASGMILVAGHSFEIGDYIDAAGASGTVIEIKLFSTKIITPDNKIITLPNSAVAGGNIVNYSTEETRRVDLTFGVAYGSDIDKVKATIESVLDKHELVLHDKGYTVRLSEQADSALIFACRCYVKNADYWTVYFDLNESMTKRFVEEGIEIPYNKLDVNVISQK